MILLQLENRAEVALLTRSIQIQGGSMEGGCRVLLAPGSTAQLQGVRISGCGQLTTSSAALQIIAAQRASISNCTVDDSQDGGISAQGTDGLILEGNTVVGSFGSSISVTDSPNARSVLILCQSGDTGLMGDRFRACNCVSLYRSTADAATSNAARLTC